MNKANFPLPCGQCMSCRKARLDSWVVRLIHESSFYEEVSFVTLTYNDEYVPTVRSVDSNSNLPLVRLSLCKKDLQDFFKRLRKRLGKKRIKYYACGEYGSNTFRPHYHAIIFGCSDFALIKAAWNRGFVKVLPFEGISSIRYIAGYIQKQGRHSEITQFYRQHGIEPPFKTQSVGLGKRYCEQEKDLLFSTLSVKFGGSKKPLPRYYRKLLNITQEDYADIIEQHNEDLFFYFFKRYPLTIPSITTFDGVCDITHFKPYLDRYNSWLKNRELQLFQKHKNPKINRL